MLIYAGISSCSDSLAYPCLPIILDTMTTSAQVTLSRHIHPTILHTGRQRRRPHAHERTLSCPSNSHLQLPSTIMCVVARRFGGSDIHVTAVERCQCKWNVVVSRGKKEVAMKTMDYTTLQGWYVLSFICSVVCFSWYIPQEFCLLIIGLPTICLLDWKVHQGFSNR